MTTDKIPQAVTPSVTGDKWLATVSQAQQVARREKPRGAEKKDHKKEEKFSKVDLISGSTWDTFCSPPASSVKVSVRRCQT
jgi:hypothetical protein